MKTRLVMAALLVPAMTVTAAGLVLEDGRGVEGDDTALPEASSGAAHVEARLRTLVTPELQRFAERLTEPGREEAARGLWSEAAATPSCTTRSR